MKIVVYEHFTSGALQGLQIPAELAAEGDAMLQTIIADMLKNTLFQPIILRDSRLSAVENVKNLLIDHTDQYQNIWQQCLVSETYFLLIAPETDGILQQLAETVVTSGKKLLGSSAEAIGLCTNKLRCSQFLQQHQLPTLKTQSAKQWLSQPEFNGALICKPNDGAGCIDTYYFHDAMSARAHLEQLPHAQRYRQIVQPFIKGEAMSLSVFIDNEPRILSLNEQIIKIDHKLSYQGSNVAVNFRPDFNELQAQALLEQLLIAMPGLWGFIGIDLLISEYQSWIVDINPRLTTSFNSLAHSGCSPATLLYEAINASATGVVYA